MNNTETKNKSTILIVDDQPANIHALAHIIKEEYVVQAATSGVKALEIASGDNPPDLILLDIMMPEMDGYEVCTCLKADEATCNIPVIFLTAKTEVEDEQKGLKFGAVDYITKPISPAILLARVNTHLRLKVANDLLKNQNDILEQKVQERTHELSLTNKALARFVPDEFLKHMQRESILDVKLGDQIQKTMTVLFSDIRGFTALSEQMPPDENFRFINAYLGQMGPIVRKHHGFIDKYIGDAIMALFDHADNALDAAIAMLRSIAEYDPQSLKSEWFPIKVGIGLNTGELMLGTIGEQNRLDTTVISDTVNLAARMEGLTKYYGVSLVVSETTFADVKKMERYHYRLLDRVKVQGKKQVITTYAVFDADPEDLFGRKLKMKPVFEKGQQHYFAREFADALKCFTDVLMVLPEDLTTKHYLKRSSKFLLEGVPDDWQGIRTMAQK